MKEQDLIVEEKTISYLAARTGGVGAGTIFLMGLVVLR